MQGRKSARPFLIPMGSSAIVSIAFAIVSIAFAIVPIAFAIVADFLPHFHCYCSPPVFYSLSRELKE